MLFISTMRPTLCLGPVLADNGWFSLPALRPHRAGPAPQAHRTSGPASSPTLARPQPPDSAASDPLSAAPFLLFDGSRASLLHTQRIAPAPLSRYRSSLSPQRIPSLRYSSQRRHPAAGPLVSFLRAQFFTRPPPPHAWTRSASPAYAAAALHILRAQLRSVATIARLSTQRITSLHSSRQRRQPHRWFAPLLLRG